MDLTRHWLDAQKSTPSFVSNFNEISDILDAPLPAALRSGSPGRGAADLSGYGGGAASGLGRSQTPNRYGSASGGFQTPRGGAARRTGSQTPRAVGGGGGAFTPGRNIHDDLIEKGKLYQQRREALREKTLQEERNLANTGRKKKKAQSPPAASKEERHRQRQDEETQRKKRFEKLFNESKKRENESHYKQIQAEQSIKKQLDNYGFKPKISSKGKKTSSRVSLVEQQSNWQRRKEEELERLRRDRIVEEMANVQEGPDISHRSQKLAVKMREKEGLAGLTHIEAMLERDRLKKLARWEDAERLKHKETANPKITLHAATLPRSGSVGDRLYAESFEMEERKAQRIREKLTERQESYAPRITPFAQSFSRERPVEDELMMRHLDALAEKDEVHRQQEDRRIEQHTPAINPVSDAIASRLPLSARERLFQPRQHQDPNETYGRSASTNSNASTVSWADREKSRQDRLEKDRQKREERMEALRIEKERKELEECSFAPRTTRRAQSPSVSSQPGSQVQPPSGEDLFARNEQWRQRRDMKLQEQKVQRDMAAVEGCTFQPRVVREDRISSRSPDREALPKGYEEFLERQDAARREREEKVRRQTVNTDTWRPGSTIPVEFNLGRHDDDDERSNHRVRALARPAGPEDFSSAGGTPRQHRPSHYLGGNMDHIASPAHFSQASRYGSTSRSPDRSVSGGAAGSQPGAGAGGGSQRLVPFSVMERQQQSMPQGALSPELAQQAMNRY